MKDVNFSGLSWLAVAAVAVFAIFWATTGEPPWETIETPGQLTAEKGAPYENYNF